ncbi:hypothetical protein BLNAU_12429 [Blattamonas nauphoetae]|uniref:Uncharacterized protein n=1 Tax=Blattamonas nauphoetae TaxID=2049346 RepID=A0ABQ9XQP5_9EUKA|nr:hypothetical protein BLNAU_12429 [Blattamonas nauphoetae]
MTGLDLKLNPSTDSPCPDCSRFMNWDEEELESDHEKAVVFRSLVATVKLQPALDVSLEARAVKLLKSVNPDDVTSANDFLCSLASNSDESLSNFVQSFVVLISSPSQIISAATMEMLDSLIMFCSAPVRLALVKSGLIPQLMTTLNPLSLSFTQAVDINIHVMTTIIGTVWLATPEGLEELENEDRDEQQAVHKTVLTQVLAPSETSICRLCINRFSIIDGEFSFAFLILLARLLEISPYHQPTMEIVLHMPVVLTVSSYLTFFKNERSIWLFLYHMINSQRDWNKKGGETRQMGEIVDRMLRMEGIEDVIEPKLQNDKNSLKGGWIVKQSIEWNNLLEMNLPKQA